MPNLRPHYGRIIIGTGALTIFSCLGLARFAYGMLLPSMGQSLGLAYDQMGFISTGNFLGYLCAVALAPYCMGRWGARRTIATGLGLLAVCMIGIGRSRGYPTILALYGMTGVGSGLANVPMMVLVSHWFSREARGRAAGIMLAGNGAAIVFAGLLVPALSRSLGADGWRTGWLILGGLSLAISALAGALLRNTPEQMGLPAPAIGTPVTPVGVPAPQGPTPGRIIPHLGFLYLLFGATYMIYGTFIVTTMVVERGMAEATAGRFWAWVGFFSLFSGPLFGTLSDRIGRKGGLMIVFAVQTLAYALASADLGVGALYLSIALYGVAAWSIPTIMAAAVGDYLGPARAAAGFSIVTFFFAAGQTVGPSLAGVVAEATGSFSSSYLMAAGLTGVGVFAAGFLKRPTL